MLAFLCLFKSFATVEYLTTIGTVRITLIATIEQDRTTARVQSEIKV